MAKGKFYACRKEGNIVGVIQEGTGTLECCGEPMQELVPNTTDAAQEKHISGNEAGRPEKDPRAGRCADCRLCPDRG